MKKVLFSLVAFILFQSVIYAQNVIPLYDGLAPNSLALTMEDPSMSNAKTSWMTIVLTPTLTTYLPEKEKATGMAVIVCPGGGYAGLAIDHEGHAMAKKLQENGIAGIVLKYRLPNPQYVINKEFVPLQDAQKAIQYIREHAAELGINPNKVGIMGSSAGGHLASTLGTHYDKAQIENPKNTSLRPDFMILNYPVISFDEGITHNGSRYNLVGELSTEEYQKEHPDWKTQETSGKGFPVSADKIEEYSNNLHVTDNTPPTFIHSAIDDKVVPVQNSLLFIAALEQHHVPVTSFFYAKGGHGYGLNNKTAQAQWIEPCLEWLKKFQ